MAVALLGAGLAVPFVDVVGADPKQEAGLTILYSFVGPAVILFVVYVVIFMTSPSRMYFEVYSGAEALTKKLEAITAPRLELSLSSEPFTHLAVRAGLAESPYGGHRQTHVLERETILRINCKNLSGIRIDACKANLVGVRAIGEDGNEIDVGFSETLSLSWTRIPKKTTEVDIEPDSTRLLYVLAFRPGGVLLFNYEGEGLPAEYHHLFSKHQKYRLWIQANGARDAAARICVEIEKKETTKELVARDVTTGSRDLLL